MSIIENMTATTEASKKGEWYYRGESEHKLGQQATAEPMAIPEEVAAARQAARAKKRAAQK